jgi:uridine phosphorylase
MQPHLRWEKPLGKYALLPGDPKRSGYIAAFSRTRARSPNNVKEMVLSLPRRG